jgi:hypothetical protein
MIASACNDVAVKSSAQSASDAIWNRVRIVVRPDGEGGVATAEARPVPTSFAGKNAVKPFEGSVDR